MRIARDHMSQLHVISPAREVSLRTRGDVYARIEAALRRRRHRAALARILERAQHLSELRRSKYGYR